jgi:hypothetical protein
MIRPAAALKMIDLLARTFILDRQLHGSWGNTPVAGVAAMPRSTYFVQECPTCGRNLQVRVEYLGKQVVCRHCGARFEACEPGSSAYPPASSSLSLLERAEQLLQTTAASGIGIPAAMTDHAMSVPLRPK